jgi:hypothetical protein
MIQIENLLQNALCAGAKPPAVMQSFTSSVTPDTGFLIQFFPCLIISRQDQSCSPTPPLSGIKKVYAMLKRQHTTCSYHVGGAKGL